VTRLLRIRWLPSAVVAAVTLLVFLPALGNGFVNWDDDENFLWNPYYRGLGWANLRWMFTAVHQGLYVPMAWLSLGLDYVLWGMHPSGYHLTSILLHAANASLFYLVARRLLATGFGDASGGSIETRVGAAFAALFFALHPLRVESVAWVTERRDVVAGLFTILTILAYLRAWSGAGGGLHRRWLWTAAGCFALALLSKSIVVGLPLVLLAIDVYPLRRLAQPSASRRQALVRIAFEKTPFLVLSAGVSAVTLGILVKWDLLSGAATLGVSQRLAVAAYGLVFYLRKMIVPTSLSPLYALVHPVDPWSWRYAWPAAAVVAISALAVVGARRAPMGLTAWVSYVLLLAPVLGLFHSGPQIVADRYSYFAGLTLALVAGAGLTWCIRAAGVGRIARPVARMALVAAIVVLAALATLTVRQVGVWHDSVRLWEHAAIVEPESDVPIFYLGWALADAGRLDEARAHFTASLGRVPATRSSVRAQLLLHRGIVEQRAGDAAAAEASFRHVLTLDPRHPTACIRLGIIRAGQGDPAAAAAFYASAAGLSAEWPRYPLWEIRAAVAEVSHGDAAARALLGLALAIALQERNALDQAEAEYRLVLRLAPRQAAAWNNLGVIHATRRRYAEAETAFVEALRIDPSYAEACRNGRQAVKETGGRHPELEGCATAARR
jgi:protein O-mannosyl-transferase